MQIEEIGSKKSKGIQFDQTQRGQEVQRLSLSLGAERNASSLAVNKSIAPTQPSNTLNDSSSISQEAIQGLNFLDTQNRTNSIISGLQESFNSNTGDQGHTGRQSAQNQRFQR